MAVLVRIDREQLDHIITEMQAIENEMKAFNEDLHRAGASAQVVRQFTRLHERHSRIVGFVQRQLELARP